MNKEKLNNVIMDQLQVIFEENGIDDSRVNGETVLFGSEGIIVSLALVSLIVKVEDYVIGATGKEIQVIDGNAVISEALFPFMNAIFCRLSIGKIK